MSVKEINETTFDSAVSEGVTLVDFWASWCMPCKAMLPILEKVATETSELGDVSIAKVNVDESPSLANRFSVSSIPSLMFFKDGQLVQRLVGVQSAQALLDAIKACRSA